MEEIYKQVAEELGISEYLVETVIKHKYSWIRKQLSNIDNPAVLDNGFGTFYLPEYRIKSYIKHLEGKPKDTEGDQEEEINKFKTILEGVSSYNKNKKLVNKIKKDE